MTLLIRWVDRGREPQEKPNPRYPNGVDIDVSSGKTPACQIALPYPAKRCGIYLITCDVCGQHNMVTTAGRKDDPRSFKIACKAVRAPDLSAPDIEGHA